MNRLTCGFFGLMMIAAATSVSAGTTKNRTLTVAGQAVPVAVGNVDQATGACNFSRWTDQCSGSNCVCDETSVISASGSMETGRQAISNMFFTVDHDIDPCTTGCMLIPGLEGRCNPVHGVLTDTVASTGESKTFNFIGVSCRIVKVSRANPGGTLVGRSLSGAWAIDGVVPPSPAASGWGSFSATLTQQSMGDVVIKLKMSGLVTQD